MNPRPPTCISASIMICPNTVKVPAVGVTERPVTQVAEVAVKSASMKFILFPCFVDIGNKSKSVPKSMTAKKPNNKILAVVSCANILFFLERVKIESFKFSRCLICLFFSYGFIIYQKKIYGKHFAHKRSAVLLYAVSSR